MGKESRDLLRLICGLLRLIFEGGGFARISAALPNIRPAPYQAAAQ